LSDMSSARDMIRESAQQLRRPEARYAVPALTFSATPAGEAELAALKQMDALLLGNAYTDATFTGILEQLHGYLTTVSKLRQVPLGEAPSAQVLRAESRA